MNKPTKPHSPDQGRGQYKDVRWMELRNSILIRDGYKCQACQGVEELQVHHVKYVKGGKIWDSPPRDLVTLCAACHRKIHGILRAGLQAPKGRHSAKGRRKSAKVTTCR